ncbi:hypothetical protein BW716_17670 [[Flexibacter] sp. ATCC 35208]|nr:hypothetical protein BW716_17670 [[Flexibacter] sp. ATCC 35208]
MSYTHAQGLVKGEITEDAGTGVPFASVSLVKQPDSLNVGRAFTDEKGKFVVKDLPYGQYLLLVSYVGFVPRYSGPFEVNAAHPEYDAGRIMLSKKSTTLNELVVASRQKAVERRADRFIFNVAASTFQTANLMDIFRALPFMDVEGEDISINGKYNILVMVDNIPKPKETVSSILETMSGQDIEKIEFITSPSSQYDASAEAVINIITRKGQLQGLTGTLNGNISQGIYANGNGGVNLTYRKQRLVVNGNLNYAIGDKQVQNNGYRVLQLDSKSVVLNETPVELFKNRTISGQVVVEYQVHPRHTLSMLVDFNLKKVRPGTLWDNKVAFSRSINGTTDSVLRSLQDVHGKTNIVNYSLNYRWKLDSMGKRMDAVVIYTPVDKLVVNEMRFQNVLSPEGDILTRRPVVRNTNPSHSSILVGQLDWQLPFMKNWKLNLGLKYSFSELTSDPSQELHQNDEWVIAPDFTFHNKYNEHIAAGYVNVQKAIAKTSISAGVRGEKTEMNVKGVYDRNFTDLFPSLIIQQTFSRDYQLTGSYRRTINRASFMELTPYQYYLDDYTILAGNPALKPLYTDLVNLNSNIRNKLFLELEYTHNKNAFAQLPRQSEGTTIWQTINLNSANYSGNVSYNYDIASWWQGTAFVRGNFYTANGLLGIENIEIDGFAWVFGINNTWSLPGDLKLDMTFNYRSPRAYGLATSRRRNFSRIALKGNLFNKKLQYVVSVADIFKEDINGFNLKTSNLQSRFYSYYDSRRVALGLVYNFGKRTVKEAAGKKLENEDILNRAN